MGGKVDASGVYTDTDTWHVHRADAVDEDGDDYRVYPVVLGLSGKLLQLWGAHPFQASDAIIHNTGLHGVLRHSVLLDGVPNGRGERENNP